MIVSRNKRDFSLPTEAASNPGMLLHSSWKPVNWDQRLRHNWTHLFQGVVKTEKILTPYIIDVLSRQYDLWASVCQDLENIEL